MITIRPLLFLLLLLLTGTSSSAYAAIVAVLGVSVDHGIPVTLNAPAASVFIANPEVADVQVMSPTSIMVFGKKTGQTTLMATDSSGRTLLHRTVVVSQDLSDLRRELASAIPGNKITAGAVPDGIILTGETRDPVAVEDARKIAARYISKDGAIINRIQVVGSNQIMLRVRFAEMSRSVDKKFGINWGDLTSVGGFVFGIASGNPVSALGSISSGLSTLNTESVSKTTSPTSGLAFSHQGSRWNVNGLIDALATDGLVTMLAEPNLTAMSGETANFLAGGQVPIVTPQPNGTVSIQYISYGISLEFTPTLVGENRINLHVKPEVSEPSTVGQVTLSTGVVTAFTTRKAETTIELASGQSFAIAGLLDNSQNQSVNKFPFLGDVPILGPLFRSTDFQNGQTELVIIITPYVVKPGMNAQAMALPMDNYSPPSDSERILGMRNSSGDPDARPMSGAPIAVPAPAPDPAIVPHAAITAPDANENADASTVPATTNNISAGRISENNVQDIAPAPEAAPVEPVAPVVANRIPAAVTPAKSPDLSTGPSGFILE